MTPTPKTMDDLREFSQQFLSSSAAKQLSSVTRFADQGEAGYAILRDLLKERPATITDLVAAKIYQTLYQSGQSDNQTFLETHYPTGLCPLHSAGEMDYVSLQQALARQDFQAADTITRQKLCELAGDASVQRKWVYFTEVQQFPGPDLLTLNQLWWLYSEGKFGYAVQRQLWLSVGQDFTKLWPKIGWRTENSWTKFPTGFTWNLSAPKGHLPLSNQLRGVRVIAALFQHPVWSTLSQENP